MAFTPGGWAKGIASGLTLGAAEGFIFGAMQAETDSSDAGERRKEIMSQAKLGAALGGFFGSASGLYASTRNWFAKKAEKYANSSAEARQLSEDFGVSLTFGQQTGSPIVRKVEFDAAGDQATLFYKDQADTLVSAFAKRIGIKNIDVLGTTLGASLNAQKGQIVEAAKNVVTRLSGQRQQAWKRGLADAVRVSKGEKVVNANEFLRSMREVEQDALNDMGYMFEMSDAWRKLKSKVEAAVDSGGATALEIDEWWRNINTWKKHGSGIIRPSTNLKGQADIAEATRILAEGGFTSKGQALAYGLSNSFDNVLKKGALPGQEAAIANLSAMRSQYKAASKVIREVNDQILKGLGADGVPAEQALMAFGKADVAVQRRVVDMLRTQEGGEIAIQSIRDAMYESAVQQASKAATMKGEVTGAIDIQTLVDGLAANNNRSMLAGIISREQEQYAAQGIKLIRQILNADPMYAATGAVKTTLPVDLTGLAINAVSRDPGFIARLLASSIQRGSTFEQLFFTKKGVEALNALRPEFVRTEKLAAARNATILGLSTFVGGDAMSKAKDNVDATMAQARQSGAQNASGP